MTRVPPRLPSASRYEFTTGIKDGGPPDGEITIWLSCSECPGDDGWLEGWGDRENMTVADVLSVIRIHEAAAHGGGPAVIDPAMVLAIRAADVLASLTPSDLASVELGSIPPARRPPAGAAELRRLLYAVRRDFPELLAAALGEPREPQP